jgi:hypothetical protein
VISAADTFSNIACGIVDLERERRFQPDVVRPIWQARCRDGRDCTVTARYGDAGARDRPGATTATLGASAAGECYTCTVAGSRGRGAVRFTGRPRPATWGRVPPRLGPQPTQSYGSCDTRKNRFAIVQRRFLRQPRRSTSPLSHAGR